MGMEMIIGRIRVKGRAGERATGMTLELCGREVVSIVDVGRKTEKWLLGPEFWM